MHDKPMISIIIGIYNGNENHMIEEAMESIIGQTMSDWECIICDDGSKDDTYKKLLKYKKKDSRFILLKNEENRGLGYSLNRCLEYTKGKYIARMDLDDKMESNRFEEQYNYLERNPQIDFCSSWIYFFNENGNWGKRVTKEYPQKEDFLFTSPFVHPALMAKRQLYDCVKYEETRPYKRCEDYNLFMMWYACGFKGANLQRCLYSYRVDRCTLKRRKYKERFFEAYVRGRGYKKLGMMPKGIIYVVKPLIVGIIPQNILNYLRKDTELINGARNKTI